MRSLGLFFFFFLLFFLRPLRFASARSKPNSGASGVLTAKVTTAVATARRVGVVRKARRSSAMRSVSTMSPPCRGWIAVNRTAGVARGADAQAAPAYTIALNRASVDHSLFTRFSRIQHRMDSPVIR
jgi:hypothetical protein